MTKKYINDILDNQIQFSFTTDGKKIKQANKAILNFLGFDSLEALTVSHDCICDFFEKGDGFLQKFQNNKIWLDIILEDLSKIYKIKLKDLNNNILIFQIFTNGVKIDNTDIVITLSDITELEKYKDELEIKFKASFKFLKTYSDAVIVSQTDTSGNITFVSNAFSKISGYNAEELIGKNHNILRHPDMPKEVFEIMWETIKKGKIWQGKIKNKKKDGGYYWVEARIYPDYSDNGKIIGYTSIRQDISYVKKEKKLHLKLKNIFDNVPIGFIIIDKQALVISEYSNESLRILSLKKEPTNNKISKVLFGNNSILLEEFEYGYAELVGTKDKLQRELYLSLLPTENKIESIIFSIEYKLLDNNKCLIIIKDITKTKELESKIQYEQQLQKMVISIISNKEESIDLIDEFKDFIDNIDALFGANKDTESKLVILNRELHTYKGLFAQKEMLYLTNEIHNIEDILEEYKNNTGVNSIEYLCEIIKFNLKTSLVYDINIIKKVLGFNFLDSKATKSIYVEHIKSVKNKIIEIINYNKPELLYEVLDSVSNMMDKTLYDMLLPYTKMIDNISIRLNKNINKLKINGDKDLFVSNWYESFIHSLVHVFRNSVDHGIEDIEARQMSKKDIYGTIECSYKKVNNNIILTILDDGRGIDQNKILKKAIEKKLLKKEDAKKLSKQEILNFIFKTNFSTNENVNLLSGRGIGLDAVMYELNKLNGSVYIDTKFGVGTSFIFTVPYDQTNYSKTLKYKDEHIILDCIADAASLFIKNDIGIDNEINICDKHSLPKYFASISLSGKLNLFCIISIEGKLLDSIFKSFIPNNIDDNLYRDMIKTLPNEVVNTIVGLAISKFPLEYKELSLSEPLAFDVSIIENLRRENYNISKKIYTKYGNLICEIIKG